jgi:hypothetical protein
MTHKDFNNVFENLDYTPEFKQKMEEKLSAKAGFIHSTNENADFVSGVERVEGNRIIYKIVTVAASIAVIAGGVGLAARIGKTPIVDSPMPPAATNATNITDATTTTTTDTTTQTTTKPVAEDEDVLPEAAPIELIDEENMTDEELTETLKKVICDADKYTYHSVTPYQYSGEVYYQQYEADPEAIGKAFIEYAVEKGWCFPADRNWWLNPDNKTKQTLYDEIYMRFTEDYKTNFENLIIEKNGKAYYEEVAYGDATAFIVDYNNIDDVKIKSRNNERIIADVYFDYSSYVISICWGQLSELGIDENYKYMYPQEVELIKTVHGWRINKYIPYAQLRDEALENCEILNEARMLSNPMYKFVGTWRQSAFPDKDYEVVVNSAEKLPDGRVYADIELKNFEKFDDFRTQIDYNEDVFGSFYITGKNGEEYHCNFNLRDDGTIYFCLMEKNELESHAVMIFTFDEKIA